MIIKVKTPSRISLFGGGCDLDSYSSKYGGVCVSLAINLYEELHFFTGDDLYHGYTELPIGVPADMAYSVLKSYKVGSMHHARIKTAFDGVIGAGLGSSGAFGVGLIAAIKRSKGERIERTQLAQEAWLEENKLWTTGKQDQFAAAYGGLNIFKFGKQTVVIPYPRHIGDQLTDYLHLFYTGGKRSSAKMQKKLDHLTPAKIDYLNQIKDIALIASGALLSGKMDLVGKLLHASWEVKRKLGVSNEKIDGIYDYARANGAMGGKLLGAGEAGYMVFFVPPEKSGQFVEKMAKKGLEETDFSIDYNGVQTRIL